MRPVVGFFERLSLFPEKIEDRAVDLSILLRYGGICVRSRKQDLFVGCSRPHDRPVVANVRAVRPLPQGALDYRGIGMLPERSDAVSAEFPDMDERSPETLARGFVSPTVFAERYHGVGIGDQFVRYNI